MSLEKLFVSSVTKLKIMDSVESESGVKIPVVFGKVSETERPSEKGYRYREGFWNRVLTNPKVKESISNRSMLGMIEHPKDDSEYLNTPYDKASHVVFDVALKNNEPYGTFGLLNNPYGNSIKALVEVGTPVGVSTRGLGEIVNDSVSDYIDEDSYALITWDFTRNPNFSELCMRQKVTDSMMQLPEFKALTSMLHLRDSSAADYSRKNLLKEISDSIENLKNLKTRLEKFCL